MLNINIIYLIWNKNSLFHTFYICFKNSQKKDFLFRLEVNKFLDETCVVLKILLAKDMSSANLLKFYQYDFYYS